MSGGEVETRSTGFSRPVTFWVGTVTVSIGVVLQLPMYVAARHQNYMLRGMSMDTSMLVGMALMVAGLVLVGWGVGGRRVPRSSTGLLGDRPAGPAIRALDDAPIGAAHVRLMLVLAAAIAIDSLKPYTLTFILPGVAKEYGLNSPTHVVPGHEPVALLPFFGILGTAIGSFVWGYLGDFIGRRASILVAAVLFIATSACSAMPSFWQNEVMCLVMGLAVGGFLPIAYALLVETVPARRRGQVVVLVAGIGTALGFLMASSLADWLIPHFGWRIMWFLGIPSGLALIVLNRAVPESPRFLTALGHDAEARSIMERFGAVTVSADHAPTDVEAKLVPAGPVGEVSHGGGRVFRRPFRMLTSALSLYGLAWGLVSFGFLVWLPIDLAHARHGIHGGQVTALLTKAALFSIPGAVFAAWLYGRSAKAAMVAFASTSALSLGAFWAFGSTITSNSALFTVVLVALLVSMWGSISVLCPYSAEVYPTSMRATGAGFAAGASKIGGVAALAMAVVAVAPPSLTGAALVSAVPMLVAALAVGLIGVETSGRALEAIAPRPKRSVPALP